MASPQKENGHIDIANELVEQFYKINLSAYEWRILWYILRKTYGWNKKMDYLAISPISKDTGISRQHVFRTKHKLLTKKIIIEKGGKLGLNKDYDQWENVASIGYVAPIGYEPKQATSVAQTGYKAQPKQATKRSLNRLTTNTKNTKNTNIQIPTEERSLDRLQISPTVEQVKDECFKQGMTDQDGERIHAHYNKKRWVDGAGQPLTDLASTITAWRLNPRRQTEQQTKPETIHEQAERLRKAGELDG